MGNNLNQDIDQFMKTRQNSAPDSDVDQFMESRQKISLSPAPKNFVGPLAPGEEREQSSIPAPTDTGPSTLSRFLQSAYGMTPAPLLAPPKTPTEKAASLLGPEAVPALRTAESSAGALEQLPEAVRYWAARIPGLGTVPLKQTGEELSTIKPELAGMAAGGAVTAVLPKIAEKVPEMYENRVIAKAAKVRESQASNLSAALEMGGRSPKGVLTHEEVAQPILDDFKSTAKKLGVTKSDFKGRAGYRAAKEVTADVRNQYNNAYDSLLDPLRNEPAPQAAMKAADDVWLRLNKDTELMDQLKGSNNMRDLENLTHSIANAKTVGDLDDMRVTLNRLSSKYASKSGLQQYQSPIFQEALDAGADAIRNSLYPTIARYYKDSLAPEDIRQLQKLHGAAIQADNMMDATQKSISSAESSESSRAGLLTRLKTSAYRLTMTPRHAAGGIFERLFPPSDVDLFNARMKRVIGGPEVKSQVLTPPGTPEVGESYVQGRPVPLLPNAERPMLTTGEIPPERGKGPGPSVGPLGTPSPGSTGVYNGPDAEPTEGPVISVNPAKATTGRDVDTGRFKKAYLGGEEIRPPLKEQLNQKLGTTPEGYNFKVIEAKPNNELTQVSHKDIQIGDSFVDNKGDIRRVVEKKGNIVKTADGSPRTYVGKVPVRELNTPKARLAQGGKLRNPELDFIEKNYGKSKDIGTEDEPFGFMKPDGRLIGHSGDLDHQEMAYKAANMSAEDLGRKHGLIRVGAMGGAENAYGEPINFAEIYGRPTDEQMRGLVQMAHKSNGILAVDLWGPGNKSFSSDAVNIPELKRAIDKIWTEKSGEASPISKIEKKYPPKDLSSIDGPFIGLLKQDGKIIHDPEMKADHGDLEAYGLTDAKTAEGAQFEHEVNPKDRKEFRQSSGLIDIARQPRYMQGQEIKGGHIRIFTKPTDEQMRTISQLIKSGNGEPFAVDVYGQNGQQGSLNATAPEIRRMVDKAFGSGEPQVLQPKKGLYKVLADKLKIGDAFVDDKGDPRRVVEIKGNKVRTADDTVRIYNKTVPMKEMNTPKSKIAQGGKLWDTRNNGWITTSDDFIPAQGMLHHLVLKRAMGDSVADAIKNGNVRVIENFGNVGFELRSDDLKAMSRVRDRVAYLPFDQKVHIDFIDKAGKRDSRTFDDPISADRWLTRQIGK